MGIEKNIKKLLSRPTEMRIDEITNILGHFGYHLASIKGSHFHFQKANKPTIILPVHHQKVSKYYIKDLSKTIKQELNLTANGKIKIHFIHTGRY